MAVLENFKTRRVKCEEVYYMDAFYGRFLLKHKRNRRAKVSFKWFDLAELLFSYKTLQAHEVLVTIQRKTNKIKKVKVSTIFRS